MSGLATLILVVCFLIVIAALFAVIVALGERLGCQTDRADLADELVEILTTENDRLNADNMRMAARLADPMDPLLLQALMPPSREASDFDWPDLSRDLWQEGGE